MQEKNTKHLDISEKSTNFAVANAFLHMNNEQMISPFSLPPHPLAQQAAAEVIDKVHAYMRSNPESELHKHGKMFGVLVVDARENQGNNYLAAFSAQLDGSYHHEGFVPPVYDMPAPPVGTDKSKSQRLQQLLFAGYRLTNGLGETKNLLEIFAGEKPIIPAEEWFSKGALNAEKPSAVHQPPSGAGECCAPKLLQYALRNGMKPFALAEFWVGAPGKTEIRQEGCFYPPCSGRCVPILRHMLRGIDVLPAPEEQQSEALCKNIDILFEDEVLLVVNKPAGLLSVPGKTDAYSVEKYLSEQRGGAPIQAAHRLDQDTSGILVLAKTAEVYKQLQSYFQRRDILKRYEAVLEPIPTEHTFHSEGTISLPLLPNPYDRPRQMVSLEHGKPAITKYVLRHQLSDGSWFVDFYPLTGRTHQLRVHAAHPQGLNAPIVGDRLYGKQTSPGSPQRLLLHAAEIAFVHPVTSEEMHFAVPSHFA